MKNVLCYLGIAFILFLVAFPPILRAVLPERKKEEKKIAVVETKLLVCTGDKFMTTTSYEGEKIKNIMIKKINQGDGGEEELETNDEEVNNLELAFKELKDIGDNVYQEVEGGAILTIDFSVSNHPELVAYDLTNTIEIQKEIYEKNQLTCEIRDL